jgi:hypothetical protein
MPHDVSFVLDRAMSLKAINQQPQSERARIRAIMNGGVDGIHAIMAWDQGKGASMSSRGSIANNYGIDLPTVNLLASGLERFAQKVGRIPTLKAPLADDEGVRKRYQKRMDIVSGWDYQQGLELQFPQVGRWLPGYAFCAWVIKGRKDVDGNPYPVAELRDPYDLYPGWFGPDQQPDDMASVRKVPLHVIKHAYPELEWGDIEAKLKKARTGRSVSTSVSTFGDSRSQTWEGARTGIEIVEYGDGDGWYYVIPEVEKLLSYVPNPLESGPAFVIGKRYNFDRQISQYHHVIGLMSQMAKLNILGLIAAEDSVFRETNIVGELESGTYERGRFAVNMFSEGSRIEKPTGDVPQQVWAQIDRLERQLRIGAAYDVSQDAISPNSFATGAAVRELQSASQANLSENQLVLQHSMQRVDARRLEWAEKLWNGRRTKVFDISGKTTHYRPSTDIKKDYRSRRMYGAMATFDDQAKIVVGLQLLQAEAMDIETMQENIDGLQDLPLINNRIAGKKALDTLFARLAQRSEQDPKADAALVQIAKNPEKRNEILTKYFTPEQPEISPEEQQMMMAQQQAGMAAAQGMPSEAPPNVTSVMSRVEASGATEAGAQTVGTMRRA